MKYEHVVYVFNDEGNAKLRIDRLFENGKRMYMCDFDIKKGITGEPELWDEFEKLSAQLGKTLCIDCPGLRLAMGLE